MSDNPYTPPKSDVEVKVDEKKSQFYIVSPKKFALLYFFTIGLYSLYWFYNNWKQYKEYTEERMLPILRAIFNIFFVHSLFRKVQNTLNSQNKSFDWSPSWLATFYVIFSIMGYALDQMSTKEIWSPYSDIIGLSLLPITYMLLIKAQKAINLCQEDPEGESNSLMTTSNYVWMVIGVLLWGLVILGFLVILGVVPAE